MGAEKQDRSLLHMQIHIAFEVNGTGQKSVGRHHYTSSSCLVTLVNGYGNGPGRQLFSAPMGSKNRKPDAIGVVCLRMRDCQILPASFRDRGDTMVK